MLKEKDLVPWVRHRELKQRGL